VNLTRYTTTSVDEVKGYIPSPLGSAHTIECILVHDEDRIVVTVDGRKVIDRIDPLAFDMIANHAVWELYEFGGSSVTPAQLLALWADSDTSSDAVPPRTPSNLLVPGDPLAGVSYANSFSFNPQRIYALGTAAAAISADLGVAVRFPKSGKLLATISMWLEATASTYAMPQATGYASQVCNGAFTGRVTAHALYTGTPGSAGTLSWQAWTPSGTANVKAGGGAGIVTVSAVAVES
jgi:hypothetical protein